MSSPIIAAVRQRRDLKESLLHTCQELAHRASIYGVARVSLNYLALKCHCCKQTIINHIKQLIALKILRKRVVWVKGNMCEVNTYFFLIDWDKRPAKGGSQISGPTLPPTKTVPNSTGGEAGKEGSITEEIATLEKSLRLYCSPGSVAYESTAERIAALRALLPGGVA